MNLRQAAMGQLVLALACITTCPARAQFPAADYLDRRVEQRIAAARATYSVEDSRDRCRRARSNPDEIVVCVDRGEDLRVPSTAQSDPASREARRARDGNIPTAPDLEPRYPGVSVAKGCFVPPCPKPPVHVIDVKALPTAPAGSDAERIANGDIPG